MPALGSHARNQLATAIKNARRVGESGARKALDSLAVPNAKPHQSMTPEGRALRNRLRAHGRQLGDVRDKGTGEQSTERLVQEVAYEHWHRMLFARYLAENGLLIEPDSGVAITLDECEELAREQGEDLHGMAAHFAQRALPQIFRVGDPALELELASEVRQKLERLLDDLPLEVFTSDDSLGWTYQFWQSERKDEVNASGVKIGAEELPAVTQLFTEHYMVQFLFHNTIGAWHAGKVLAANPDLADAATSEDELRRAVRLKAQGGYDFDYLRFVREAREGDEDDNPTGPWRPAAGAFEDWPRTEKEITVLDPCCGSGHFLVEAFELLVRLQMDEEGINLEDAIRSVMADNLHGLELDQRCTQIAAFNLALAAWKLAGGLVELPPLNIACSGLAPNATKEEWLALAEVAAEAGGMPADRDLYGVDDSLMSARLKTDLADLYDLFNKAPVLGSLIDPEHAKGALYQGDFALLEPLLGSAFGDRDGACEQNEKAVAAHGMARAVELLAGTYTLAITNVPYLGSGQQSDSLKEFVETHFREGKADLATVFVMRMFGWLGTNGTAAVVTPQTWLFLGGYKHLRKHLLERRSWNAVARLGPNAFRDMNFWAATTALTAISVKSAPENQKFLGIDASKFKDHSRKRDILKGLSGSIARCFFQKAQESNPDHRILLREPSRLPLASTVAGFGKGSSTGDSARLLVQFWELPELLARNEKWLSSTRSGEHWSGRRNVTTSALTSPAFLSQLGIALRGQRVWGRRGIAIKLMNDLIPFAYDGEVFDHNMGVIVPIDESDLTALWCWCNSDEFEKEIREIDQKVYVTPATLVKVPVDIDSWRDIAKRRYSEGFPEPESSDPTQWLFHGYPSMSRSNEVLQVAVGRLLGYRWPPEFDPDMRLADEQRAWVNRCRGLRSCVDGDGIVCLTPLRGERSGADRLRLLLATAFGDDWSAAKESELVDAAGDGRNSRVSSLEDWLHDRFFEDHFKLFHHRPFGWHIWDGRRDGFNCLVNAHRLTGPGGEGRRTLEALTYSYLGDWIDRQRAEQREGREGAEGRLAAALDLQRQLEKILEGEPPYDLFVRWKPLHEQAIGWEPDINDGIRLNIRPFMSAELRKGGRKGAGILRWKPNIKWGPKADRGKDPETLRPKNDFPWFWSCPGTGTDEERTDFQGGDTFDGNRWNDLHYTNAAKQAARAKRSDEHDA